MSRKTIITVVIILVGLGLVVFLLTAILGPSIGNVFVTIVSTAGEDFLQALKDSDYEIAYALLHPDLRSELSGPDALEELFPPTLIDTWEYETTSATTTDGEPAVTMTGILTLSDGSQFNMEIFLVTLGEDSKVAGFSFEPR